MKHQGGFIHKKWTTVAERTTEIMKKNKEKVVKCNQCLQLKYQK